MEFFKSTNIDFLGKKWYFLSFTMALFVIGMVSLARHHGPKMGIDFTGGTVLDVKFNGPAPIEKIRHALETEKAGESVIQPVGGAQSDEVLISLPLSQLNDAELEKGERDVLGALYRTMGSEAGKTDLNNTSVDGLTSWMVQKDPNQWAGAGAAEAQRRYRGVAEAILHDFRDVAHGGLIPSMGSLSGVAGVNQTLLAALQQDYYLGAFTVRSRSIIGPQVGGQLRGQAWRATLYALLGMLVYIAFRFEWIYGVAAVVAVFHDVLITLGMFSVARLPITLTVVAAFLTLVGYSMNDTIVVFDRVRENLRLMRREKLAEVVNRSINQTLSRTILTSGLTFLSVLCLLTLGGDVLRGFSFAMTFGILVGTYSSIAVAAPMMVAYIEWRNQRSRPSPGRTEKLDKVVRIRG